MQTPAANPSRENWTEFLPMRPGITVEHLRAFRDYLVIEERDRGLTQVALYHFPSNTSHRIEFDEPVYTVSVDGNAEYDTEIVRFDFTSLITPESVYDYNMRTRERELKKREPVLGGYDPAQYASERLYVKATDGVEIPISLVYKKNFVKDGR